MNLKMIWYSILMLFIPSGVKRAEYLKRRKVYGKIGDNVMIQSRKIPLYPERISIGNNVRIASNVTFVTHDVCHNMLNNLPEDIRGGYTYSEKCGDITIGDNVFIGANSVIMYDVTIGDNVIIGAGSIVTKNVPSNSVCVGVPCRKIGEFLEFIEKRKSERA